MAKPSTSLFVTALAAAPFLVLGAALSVTAACSDPDGVTPDCTFNVNSDGIEATDNGCEGFALCLDDSGNKQSASACCVDDKGKPLTGDTLASCLYGYGEGTPTGSGGSGGSGGTGGTGGSP